MKLLPSRRIYSLYTIDIFSLYCHFIRSYVREVPVFSCNLPPGRTTRILNSHLAEGSGSFTCYCGNTEWNGYRMTVITESWPQTLSTGLRHPSCLEEDAGKRLECRVDRGEDSRRSSWESNARPFDCQPRSNMLKHFNGLSRNLDRRTRETDRKTNQPHMRRRSSYGSACASLLNTFLRLSVSRIVSKHCA